MIPTVENANNFVPEKQSAQEIMRAKLIKAQAIKLAYVAVERKVPLLRMRPTRSTRCRQRRRESCADSRGRRWTERRGRRHGVRPPAAPRHQHRKVVPMKTGDTMLWTTLIVGIIGWLVTRKR